MEGLIAALGIAAGAGWGVAGGLLVALLVALRVAPRFSPPPGEQYQSRELAEVEFPFGRRAG